MRNFAFLLILSLLGFVETAFAQQEKLYVVMTEAAWCPYCKANGERVHKLLDSYLGNMQMLVYHHNMTTKETIAKSNPVFEKLKITETMARYNEAAMIYLINAKTKKTINGFKIKLDDAAIKQTIEKALASVQ